MSDSSTAFVIPSVDISPYLANPESEEAQNVILQVRDGCRTSGFFQITGHGIPRALQNDVLGAAKRFFGLSTEEKQRYSSVPGRGYETIGEQILEPGTKPELKEGYFVGREDTARKPPFRNFEHPNVWPSESIPDADFKVPLLQYHQEITALAEKLLILLGRGLVNADVSIFQNFIKAPVASVRLLHYPPQPSLTDPNQRGAGAHTDFGAITLLLQDGETSGLEVYNKTSSSWVGVPPNADAYVVNIGDILHHWTNGEYSSTLHRVINKSGRDRYSVPFFYDGNLDCVLKPLDGRDNPAWDSVTVEQQLNRRYKESYVDKTAVKAH